MLNKEKYREKIFEIAVNHDTCGVKNGEVRSCGELSCYDCDFIVQIIAIWIFKNGQILDIRNQKLTGAWYL